MTERALKPWTKVGEAIRLAGKFGKYLISQGFENPVTGTVEDFILYGQRDWSIVLAVTEENQVLTVRQFKQGCDKFIVELPAGTADFTGETPEEVMKRELLQETGFVSTKITYLGSFWIASRSSPTRFHSFLATGCRKIQQAKYDVNEEIEAREIPLGVWLAQIQDNQIDEPSSIVTTHKALSHLGYQITKTD